MYRESTSKEFPLFDRQSASRYFEKYENLLTIFLLLGSWRLSSCLYKNFIYKFFLHWTCWSCMHCYYSLFIWWLDVFACCWRTSDLDKRPRMSSWLQFWKIPFHSTLGDLYVRLVCGCCHLLDKMSCKMNLWAPSFLKIFTLIFLLSRRRYLSLTEWESSAKLLSWSNFRISS